MIEMHMIIHSKYTQYRVRPNPDTDEGYKGGAEISWRDPEISIDWTDEMHIEPDALADLAAALALAAREAGSEED